MLLSWIFLHLLQVFVYARNYTNHHHFFPLSHISLSSSSSISKNMYGIYPPPIPIAAGRQLHIVPSPLNGFFWLFPTILNIFSFVFFINEIVTRCYYFCCYCRRYVIIDCLIIGIKKLPPPTFIVSQYVRKSCIHNILISLVVVRPPSHVFMVGANPLTEYTLPRVGLSNWL